MIKKPTKNNYRQYYKEHYGIEFGSEFSIHHLDRNRNNNDINNLLLIPSLVHQRYHFLINAIGGIQDFDFHQLVTNANNLQSYFAKMSETIKEMGYWANHKFNYDYNGLWEHEPKHLQSAEYQSVINKYIK